MVTVGEVRPASFRSGAEIPSAFKYSSKLSLLSNFHVPKNVSIWIIFLLRSSVCLHAEYELKWCFLSSGTWVPQVYSQAALNRCHSAVRVQRVTLFVLWIWFSILCIGLDSGVTVQMKMTTMTSDAGQSRLRSPDSGISCYKSQKSTTVTIARTRTDRYFWFMQWNTYTLYYHILFYYCLMLQRARGREVRGGWVAAGISWSCAAAAAAAADSWVTSLSSSPAETETESLSRGWAGIMCGRVTVRRTLILIQNLWNNREWE